MPRVEIELPERFAFGTELEVRVSDLNYGNHVGNDGVLTLIHEARRRYLLSLGEDEIGKDGLGFVIADAALVYRAQAFYGDRLLIEVAAAEVQSRSCSFLYRVSKQQVTVAEARTGVVRFDFKAQKAVAMPAELLHKLGAA
ncbi:MAG TPA: thioesterase family protein [Gammaproteobacteria bacterium]